MQTPLSPLDFARRTRRLYPDREAVIDGDLRFTYAQFFNRCARWSAALQNMGVGHGDRVAIIAPNIHANLEQFYAVPQIGAVLVPINYRLTADDFAYIIHHSGAKVVCAHTDYVAAVESIRERIPSVETYVALDAPQAGWVFYEEALAAAPAEFAPPEPAIAETDLLSINYTSGTTARPKGVMITHRNAHLNVVGTLLHLRLGLDDRYLWTLPMFHANGWTFVWIVTAVGAAHICLPKTEPRRIFDHVRSERATWLCAAPTVLIGLANAPADARAGVPRGVNVVTAGAAPAAATIERLEGEMGWEVTQMYGLTETSPFITICEPRAEHRAMSSTDRATIKARQGVELITSGEIRVVDDDGRDVPGDGNTLGEIVARGNVIMEGYFHDPEATERAMGTGWFRTGDAAVMHADGYIEIRDRLKDVIISGGENISSLEVEGALLRHPAIQEVAVVGMADEKWGESPHAFVVLREGASATPPEIIEFARTHLAHFKAPRFVHLVAELPKTATGKIQKYVLRRGASAVSRQ